MTYGSSAEGNNFARTGGVVAHRGEQPLGRQRLGNRSLGTLQIG